MDALGEMATTIMAVASIDFFITGWSTACVVQSKSSRHEGDGDQVDANINPSLVSDPEIEVETEPEASTMQRMCAVLLRGMGR